MYHRSIVRCVRLVWLTFVVAVLLPANRSLSVSSSQADVRPLGPVRAAERDRAIRSPVFRLGDAARPFGWSTVVGDFNTDGTPDVAVADRVGRRTSGYAYRLEFSVSGKTRRDVTFESSHESVTIRVADVDRDNDLDIIVGTPSSGETVGVWLNDGHGNFTAGDVRHAPATIAPLQSIDTTDSVRVAAFGVTPRRTDDGAPASLRAPPGAGSAHRSTASPQHPPLSAFLSSRTNPRAPPSRLDALS